MNAGYFGSNSLSVESRQVWHAGFRDDSVRSWEPQDSIAIQGMGDQTSAKNPQFLAVLEERVVSFLV